MPVASHLQMEPLVLEAEALAVANALSFRLAGYVYSCDLDRGWCFAEKLETGAVGINVNDTTELQAPFGG
jgi:succinate-semialdehyde dehydrogenase/glutarate-semialdehyde dehydrogenase